MNELLGCPFCGGSDVKLRHHHAGSMSWVSCVGCGLEAPSETGVTDEQAVEYWNRRALSAAQAQPVAIKPLEWIRDERNEHEVWIADDAFGQGYRVFQAWRGEKDKWGYVYEEFHDTPEAAKAAAQSDYESRVLSALSTQAVDETETLYRWRGPKGGWIYDAKKPSWHSERLEVRASPEQGEKDV